jgi:hypothetical protein
MCKACDSGFYSMKEFNKAENYSNTSAESNNCKICPENAIGLGRDLLLHLSNYFIKNYSTAIIVPCPIKSSCPSQYQI